MSSRQGAATTCTPIGNLPSAELPQRTTTTGQPRLLNVPVYCSPSAAVPGGRSMISAGLPYTGQINTSYEFIQPSILLLASSACAHAATNAPVDRGCTDFMR